MVLFSSLVRQTPLTFSFITHHAREDIMCRSWLIRVLQNQHMHHSDNLNPGCFSQLLILEGLHCFAPETIR